MAFMWYFKLFPKVNLITYENKKRISCPGNIILPWILFWFDFSESGHLMFTFIDDAAAAADDDFTQEIGGK